MALVVQRQALMRHIQGLARFAAVSAALLPGACGHSSTRESSPASPAAVDGSDGASSPTSIAAAELIAGRWLTALRDQDHGVLTTLTAFPFGFQTPSSKQRCRSGAETPDELRSITTCIVADGLLLEELRRADDFHLVALPQGSVPVWARAVQSESNRDRVPVKAFINGDGVTYVFVLLVKRDRVETCIEHVELEQG